MGPHPFLTYALKYIESVKTVRSEATIADMRRRYRNINYDLEYLKKEGRIKSTSPMKLTDVDILEYINLLMSGEGPGREGKNKPLKAKSIHHNLGLINDLCKYANGTDLIAQVKHRHAASVPKIHYTRLPPMSPHDTRAIIEAANKVKSENWRHMVAYAMTIVSISGGLRNKELRMANLSDLDLDAETIYTEHVKGEDTYGQARTAPINPLAIPFLRRYVDARQRELTKRGVRTPVLFPALSQKSGTTDREMYRYSINGTTCLRRIVMAETGIKYDLRKCRRTFGQALKNDGASIEAISVSMGHSSTKTTEKSYARMTNECAIAEAQEVWHKTQVPNPSLTPQFETAPATIEPEPTNSPLIGQKKWDPGYA
ncbi:tyrosine-type recombinase/integrase [Candidatus Methanomassiliicoccus intestinalis]|uniref:Site-specific recombinase XerD n=2 Tax=Candidatus Methanomassiliicoccus intestinalis TaxID=1406512 RepID=R9T9P6_METII|nr:site-specific integrase [Candidatus Methanomassiliicoccus intestinalis]AGN26381.1 Site-specific recombinase XerD [Candidatus Methanomassiliicoccus intestinalis Issoire-Mx1]